MKRNRQKQLNSWKKNRSKFESEKYAYLFAYNGACVYSRAAEKLNATEQSEERDAKIKSYTDKAISELQISVKKGFQPLSWMREDPDLKFLHNIPEFREVSQLKDEEKKPQE